MDDKHIANQLQRLSERLSRGLQRREWVRREDVLIHLETGTVIFVDDDEVCLASVGDNTLLYRGPEPKRFLSALSDWLKAFSFREGRQMRLVSTGAQTISVDSETIPFTTTTAPTTAALFTTTTGGEHAEGD